MKFFIKIMFVLFVIFVFVGGDEFDWFCCVGGWSNIGECRGWFVNGYKWNFLGV